MTECSKCAYPTPWHASRALKSIQRKRRELDGKIPRRMYPCAVCGGWHLTSMSKSEVAWLRRSSDGQT